MRYSREIAIGAAGASGAGYLQYLKSQQLREYLDLKGSSEDIANMSDAQRMFFVEQHLSNPDFYPSLDSILKKGELFASEANVEGSILMAVDVASVACIAIALAGIWYVNRRN